MQWFSGRRRRLWIVLATLPVLALGLWLAIHRVRWLGPLLADTARSIAGPAAVAKLEEVAYGVEDRINLEARKDEQPQAYWPVDTNVAPPLPAPKKGEPAPFRPADVGPSIPRYAAPGDGVWMPMVDARKPDVAPAMYKTLLHPDAKRPWTAIAVVAVDLRNVDLHLVAGRAEPESSEKGAYSYERKAIVPEDAQDTLLAAFNGGFKAVHGHWGMMVDGVTLIRPRPEGCTIALYKDGSMAVKPWKAIADTADKMVWFRQTPTCLVDGGKLSTALNDEATTAWGAAIGGDTVIRRSAIGLSEDRQTLFVAIGDAAMAPVIAKAMKHAGAASVAQLDVNWAFPRFLTYEAREPGGPLVAKPLCKGFEFSEDEYIRERATRDFFYLARKR